MQRPRGGNLSGVFEIPQGDLGGQSRANGAEQWEMSQSDSEAASVGPVGHRKVSGFYSE